MDAWIEDHELQAYGICGLTPSEFGALTIPEFHSVLEASHWQEARWRKFFAMLAIQLLSPHLKQGTNLQVLIDRWLGGDPEQAIMLLREKRLKRRREGAE